MRGWSGMSSWCRSAALAVACAVVTTSLSSVHAQAPVSTASDTQVAMLASEMEAAVRRRQLLPLAADPGITSLAAAPANQVAFEVSKEGASVGKARLAFPIAMGSAIDVVLQGKLTDGAGIPLTGAGLSDGASVRVGVHHTLWTRTSTVDLPSFRRLIGPAAAGERVDQPGTRFEQIARVILEAEQNVANVDVQRSGGSRLRRLLSDMPADVSAGTRMRTLANRAVAQGFVSGESTVFLDGAYERNSQTFDFTNLTDLSTERTNETGETVSFSLGYGRTGSVTTDGPKQPLFYAAVSFTGGRSFTGAPKQQICLPVADTVATRCSSIATRGPTEADAELWTVEVRQWLRQQKIGLNPVFTRDGEARVSTFVVNVSSLVFKKDDQGMATYELDGSALTAGIRIGYTFDGEQKGASFSIFFGSVLGLW